jgi:hypothetical protein
VFSYYLTRIQFYQYLIFLQDVGSDLIKNDAISDDIKSYGDFCKKLLNYIRKQQIGVSRIILSPTFFSETTKFFESLFSTTTFYSTSVYDNFFNNYQFLLNCSYGFILTYTDYEVTGVTYYFCQGEQQPKPVPTSPFTLHNMLGDAIRWYPVIQRDGNVVMTAFINGKWKIVAYEKVAQPIWNGDCHINQYDGLFGYYSFNWNDAGDVPVPPVGYHGALETPRLYPVGIRSISNYKGRIRGYPFMSEVPFDCLGNFASG